MGETRKSVRYSHDPFKVTYRGVTAECDKDGKITLRQQDPEDPEAYDQIETSAGLIMRIHSMLGATRKVMVND